MSFTNINDPAAVKALLDQLRVSQAWQDAVTLQPTEEQPPQLVSEQFRTSPGIESPTSAVPSSSASVAALLSQLKPSTSSCSSSTPQNFNEPDAPGSELLTVLPHPPQKLQDPKTLTFQQSLPRIAQLSDDPAFVAAITQLKKEQDDLERRLWEDRRDIYRKYEEKVKVAMTKAQMIGDSGLSKHEADMFQDGLQKAIEKFDRDRVLIAWDGLVSKQQTKLAQFTVPAMFPTTEPTDRERQQRIMNVLEGILRT